VSESIEFSEFFRLLNEIKEGEEGKEKVLEEKMKEYQTSDLSLGAYLLMKGLKLKKAEKIQSGKFIFLFSDPDDRGNVLAIEFLRIRLLQSQGNLLQKVANNALHWQKTAVKSL